MIKVIKEREPAAGSLGKKELYALAIGQVIGAGVITLIVPAIKMTGYSAWLAYLVAILMGFIMVAPTVFVSSTLRLAGGNYSMLCDLASPTVAGVFAYTFLTQCVSLSLFGVAAAAYIGDVIPALGSPTARAITGIALLTFFYVVNLMGIDIMAKVQKLMTWLLIAALVIFAIVGSLQIQLPIFNFSDPNFLVNGWGIKMDNGIITGGFTGAVLLFVYSCQGYSMTIAYGRDSKDARRDIPFAILMSVPTLVILYVGVAIAATGSMSIEDYGESTTLVFAAQRILSPALYYVFIIGGPIMALLSTLNSSFAYNAITIGQSTDDGWLPQAFGKENKNGARTYILTFMYIIGIVPIIFGFSVTVITNMIQLIVSYIGFLQILAFMNLPKKYPQSWKKSRYHIPDGLYYLIVILSLLGFLAVFVKSIFSMSIQLAMVNIVSIVVLTAIGYVKAKKGNIEIHTSVWSGEED